MLVVEEYETTSLIKAQMKHNLLNIAKAHRNINQYCTKWLVKYGWLL